MNEFDSYHLPWSDSRLSRRDFLKLSGFGLMSAVTFPYLWNLNISEENQVKPEVVSGVEVYGLNGEISTGWDFQRLAAEINVQFLIKNDKDGVVKKDRLTMEECKDKFLPADKRYVTAVIKKSVYEGYKKQIGKFSVNYPEWLKLHVDLFNRVVRSSLIPTKIGFDLRRVIVVDDDMDFSFVSNELIDSDAYWIESTDYRESKMADGVADYMWKYKKNEDGSLEMTADYTYFNYGEKLTLPSADDLFLKINEGFVDLGIIHELIHLLGNAPDQYTHDVSKRADRLGFRLNTWGFHKPKPDPFVVSAMNENVRRRIRGYYFDSKGIGVAGSMVEKYYYYGLVPNKVDISIPGASEVRFLKSVNATSDYYSEKRFEKFFSSKTVDSKINIDDANSFFGSDFMDDKVERLYPTTYLLRVGHQGNDKELYLSRSVLNMAWSLGETDRLSLQIDFIQSPSVALSEGRVQTMDFVKKSEVDTYFKLQAQKGNYPYAKMNLGKSDLVCVWVMAIDK